MPPSAMFYNDTLRPHAKNGTVYYAELPNPKMPLVVIGVEGRDESVDEVRGPHFCFFCFRFAQVHGFPPTQRASWFNPDEIAHILSTVTTLIADSRLSSPPLQQAEIGVMAPWRAQVWKLREELRAAGLSGVDVGTVEVRGF
jgi:superfamily I DNA and/or RNA helicase